MEQKQEKKSCYTCFHGIRSFCHAKAELWKLSTGSLVPFTDCKFTGELFDLMGSVCKRYVFSEEEES